MPDTPLLSLEDAQLHPLWEAQVALEERMMSIGAEAVTGRIVSAMENERMASLKPVQGLITEALPKVASELATYLKAVKRQRGPVPVASLYLLGTNTRNSGGSDAESQPCDEPEAGSSAWVEPHSAVLIAMKIMLNGMASTNIDVTGLSVEIGRTIEHESRVRAWAKHDPKLYQAVQRRLRKDGSTAPHIARVNLREVNRAIAEGGSLHGLWEPWDVEVHFRVGALLIDTIVRVTGWFSYEDDPEHIFKRGVMKTPKRVILPKAALSKWLAKALAREKLMSPALTPTVIPPKRWNGTREGGYWTPFVRSPRLIRFKASQQDQRENAADEYEALDMPKVYEAVHFLQEVPWRVNRKVLEVAQRLFDADHGEAKLPMCPATDWPAMPADLAATVEEAKAYRKANPAIESLPDALSQRYEAVRNWKRERGEAKRTALKNSSRWYAAQSVLQTAWDYAEFDRFYFPHMVDFRGRAYPIPTHLQPQGTQLAKGLLEFAEGRPITEGSGGAGWLAIHLASSWGNDKWDFNRRIAWTEENEAMWRSIAADPHADKRWTQCDKPFLALAAILDWVGFLEHGFGYVSHLPVSVDGTCNGIQHLAAMTRDAVAGQQVNLTPNEAPADIYKTVADLLTEDLERISKGGGEAGEHADFWLRITNGRIPRELTKRPVMVLPYGGTREAFFTYVRAWLIEHHPDMEIPEDATDDDRISAYTLQGKRLAMLTGRLWDIVKSVVSGGVVVMKWLQDCAKHSTDANQPIYWVTPSGFVVRHFYGVQKSKKMKLKLNGEECFLKLSITTKDLDIQSQLRGIAPNFVHSLDASALVDTLVMANGVGLGAVTTVHDAYGTHAADMWTLFKLLRTAFIQTHNADIVGLFRNACQSIMVGVLVAAGKDPLEASQIADETLPQRPAMGDLDLEVINESDYFFA